MTTEAELSGTKKIRAYIAGQATAGTADEFVVAKAARNMKIIAVSFIPKTAVTSNGTNYYTMTLRNRGAADAGTTVIASRALSATDIAARTADALTMSATAADANVAAGDMLTCEKLITASGLALPAGTLEVSYQER